MNIPFDFYPTQGYFCELEPSSQIVTEPAGRSRLGFRSLPESKTKLKDLVRNVKCPYLRRLSFAVRNPIEGGVRRACRDAFKDQNMIGKIVPDIYEMLGMARVGSKFVDITAWESLKTRSV